MALVNLFVPKHQRIVTQCYPKGKKNFEKQPKSSELSYLLYYCNSRRTKLKKVSIFLHKKAQKDIRSKKVGDVYVTIIILSKIIESCKENLAVYFDDFISIIFDILKVQLFTKDEYILNGIVHFLETLCENMDNALITNDQTEKLEKFLKIFFYSIIPQTISDMDAIQKQFFLRAASVLPSIKSLKHTIFYRDLFYDSVYKTLRMYQIINTKINEPQLGPDLKVLENEGFDSGYQKNTDDLISRRLTHSKTNADANSRSSIEVVSSSNDKHGIMFLGLDDIDPNVYEDDVVKKLCLQNMKEVFGSSESDLLPLAIKALNATMIEIPNIDYYKFVISGIQVQMRYLAILVTINAIVNSSDKKSQIYTNYENTIVLLRLISQLMLSEVSIVALSVLDIIKKLVNHQIMVASTNSSVSKHIAYTIAVMNTRLFYKEQLNDVIHEFLDLVEKYSEDSNPSVLNVLYDDLSMVISNLNKQNSQISLSLFNDVTMVMRNNLSEMNYKTLFDKTLKSTDLNNQNCLTFFESIRQLTSFGHLTLSEHIIHTALSAFKENMILGGLRFYKIAKNEDHPITSEYFIYHVEVAKFLGIKDYENKAVLLKKENRYFKDEELLNYYSDDTVNPYSTKGSKILSNASEYDTSMNTVDQEAQAKEEQMIINMMNTSLQSLSLPKSPSFTRNIDTKSLSGLTHEESKLSVNDLKSLLSKNKKSDTSKEKALKTSNILSQSVKSKVTNVTFLLSELDDANKNLRLRMPNEDKVSQLDERIIQRNKINRKSLSLGRNHSFNKGISSVSSRSSIDSPLYSKRTSTAKIIESEYNDQEEDDDFDFVDASSDVSSIGELDNRGTLFS
ncbi:uncharacterized protein HGUI_02959 [Hanseniaspora guilliermondii]|uniref:Protein EFR3 n=1 Tax=Hanseniaspora guilliermondii TaxID=56406 RepID=A0A1L0D0V1_9ASCO|nr:uncharacterized protein HGUI_02959 [Hanseniaspora guilliermondii]